MVNSKKDVLSAVQTVKNEKSVCQLKKIPKICVVFAHYVLNNSVTGIFELPKL